MLPINTGVLIVSSKYPAVRGPSSMMPQRSDPGINERPAGAGWKRRCRTHRWDLVPTAFRC
jgi:hypothetical protein